MRGRREGKRRKEREVAFCKETGVKEARTRHRLRWQSLAPYSVDRIGIVLVLIGLI